MTLSIHFLLVTLLAIACLSNNELSENKDEDRSADVSDPEITLKRIEEAIVEDINDRENKETTDADDSDEVTEENTENDSKHLKHGVENEQNDNKDIKRDAHFSASERKLKSIKDAIIDDITNTEIADADDSDYLSDEDSENDANDLEDSTEIGSIENEDDTNEEDDTDSEKTLRAIENKVAMDVLEKAREEISDVDEREYLTDEESEISHLQDGEEKDTQDEVEDEDEIPEGEDEEEDIKDVSDERTKRSTSEWWRVTYDAEGNDIPSSPYFSRKLHVPSGSSGLTIGRGYDMKMRTKSSVKSDLISAGVSSANAEKISQGAGLSGNSAKRFITQHNLQHLTITNAQQKALFKIELNRKIATAKRIFTKSDVVQAYGSCDFDTRSPAIKGLVIDLLYRGDYTGTTRRFLQPAIVRNDLRSLLSLMSDRSKWSNVPSDRFNRRKAYLQAAVGQPTNVVTRRRRTADTRRRTTSTWRRRTSTWRRRTSIWRRRTSIFRRRASTWRRRTSILRRRASTWRRRTSIWRRRTSILRRRTSIFRRRASTWRRRTSILRRRASTWRRRTSFWRRRRTWG